MSDSRGPWAKAVTLALPTELDIDNDLNDESSSGFGDTTSSSDDDSYTTGKIPPAVKRIPVPSAKQKHINRRRGKKEKGDDNIRTASATEGIDLADLNIKIDKEDHLATEEDNSQSKRKKSMWSRMKSRVSKTIKSSQFGDKSSSKKDKNDISLGFDAVI